MLHELINEKFDFELSQIWIGLLGEIKSYNKAKRSAEVEPLLKSKNQTGYTRLPIIKCPVNTLYSNDVEIIPDYKTGDIVELKGNIYPIDKQIKGQVQEVNSFRFILSNCSIIGGHAKQPSIINPSLIKDGLVIAHKDGTYIRVHKDIIDIVIDSDTSIKMKKDEVTIKSKKVIIDGDASVKGKLEVDEEITWNNATVPTHSSSHTHGTAVGPTTAPTPGT